MDITAGQSATQNNTVGYTCCHCRQYVYHGWYHNCDCNYTPYQTYPVPVPQYTYTKDYSYTLTLILNELTEIKKALEDLKWQKK